jgi:hypothetical protein
MAVLLLGQTLGLRGTRVCPLERILVPPGKISFDPLTDERRDGVGPRAVGIDQEPFPRVLDARLIDDAVIALGSRVGIIGRAAPDADRLLEGVHVLAKQLDALRAAVWHVAGPIVEPDMHLRTEDVLPL